MPVTVLRFTEDAGHLSQSLGVGRAIGQVYALLYFSPRPLGLADMQESLGISKGSASMTVRQLEQWGAVRKVWVKGDRRDYYEANDWIGQILRNVLVDTIGKRLAQTNSLLAEIPEAGADTDDSDAAFIRKRLDHLRKFQLRARKVWSHPLVVQLIGRGSERH